jgi:hypothetical protein
VADMTMKLQNAGNASQGDRIEMNKAISNLKDEMDGIKTKHMTQMSDLKTKSDKELNDLTIKNLELSEKSKLNEEKIGRLQQDNKTYKKLVAE